VLAPRRAVRSGRRAKSISFLLSALVCIVFAEAASRSFWRFVYGVPLRDPGRILYAYYPGLRSVDTLRPSHEDEFYDILLLGASTLHKNWGEVELSLLEQLAHSGHRNVRIFNLAQPAHTSRDSLLKYAAVGEARFELVIVYDGINDARANNVPPELFREDYGHYSWYETVNALGPYHGTSSFALPYTLRYLGTSLRHAMAKDRYVPPEAPREDWVQYGRDPRSAVSFEHNLGAILDLAARRGDRVMLMTFATYVPENYTLEAFRAKRLNYGLHRTPIELIGAREHVMNTVAVHNGIIRSLAARHEGVLFVDQAGLMAGEPRYFNDVCHLTVVGSSKFVENLLAVLLPNLRATKEKQILKIGKAGSCSSSLVTLEWIRLPSNLCRSAPVASMWF
jgi:hypothetical protein